MSRFLTENFHHTHRHGIGSKGSGETTRRGSTLGIMQSSTATSSMELRHPKLRLSLAIFLVTFLSTHLGCSATIAYPGWSSGRQPDGSNTGEDFILIGTAEYHYVVVETDDTSYPAMRGGGHHGDHNRGNGDDHLYFATMGSDGRLLPTNLQVGSVKPDDSRYSQVLRPGMKEKRHAIHAQCLESDYCKWKKEMQEASLSQPSSSITVSSGTIANLTATTLLLWKGCYKF